MKTFLTIFIGLIWIVGIFGSLFYLYKKNIHPELTDPTKINERKELHKKELQRFNSSQNSLLSDEDNIVIKKFNWGAFLCSILWALLNGSSKAFYIGLLTIIPIFGLIPAIYIGINANKWVFPKYKRTLKEFVFEQNLILIFCLVVSIIVNSYIWDLVR